jgi:hypothetical protein
MPGLRTCQSLLSGFAIPNDSLLIVWWDAAEPKLPTGIVAQQPKPKYPAALRL